MTAIIDKATYACINFGEAVYPQEIEKRFICIKGDIGKVLRFSNKTAKVR